MGWCENVAGFAAGAGDAAEAALDSRDSLGLVWQTAALHSLGCWWWLRLRC